VHGERSLTGVESSGNEVLGKVRFWSANKAVLENHLTKQSLRKKHIV
jgi:hypothetical protein